MTPAKPSAREDAINAPFFDGLRNGVLQLQHCEACDAVMDYPRLACPRCLSDSLRFVASPGRGTIHSFTIVQRHYDPSFHDDLPFVVVLVDLKEGVRMLTTLPVDRPEPDRIAIGAAVVIEPFVDSAGRALHRARFL